MENDALTYSIFLQSQEQKQMEVCLSMASEVSDAMNFLSNAQINGISELGTNEMIDTQSILVELEKRNEKRWKSGDKGNLYKQILDHIKKLGVAAQDAVEQSEKDYLDVYQCQPIGLATKDERIEILHRFFIRRYLNAAVKFCMIKKED